ncbi:MAG: cobyrinic acid a,c-diamide synthase [Ramlibacter sp.]|nr:cobyrinic acid a,c-diamide synthase [Ramlibacter sp.]
MQVGHRRHAGRRPTIAADKLQEFVASLGLPVLRLLWPTQNDVHLAAGGLTLFEVGPNKVERNLAQWQPITTLVDA